MSELIKWADENRWMESMRGARWNALVKEYNTEFRRAVVGGAPTAALKKIARAFSTASAAAAAEGIRLAGDGAVEIRPGRGLLFSWSAPGLRVGGVAAALDCSGDALIATIEEVTSEQYKCIVRREGRVVWKSPGVAMEEVAVVGAAVYYIEQGAVPLWRAKLWLYDSQTGKRQLLFEEVDRTYQLSLVRGADHCLFLKRSNYETEDLFHVHGRAVRTLSTGARAVHPVGGADPAWFEYRGDTWHPHGKSLQGRRFPFLSNCAIDFVDLEKEDIVIRRYGLRTRWRAGRAVRRGYFTLAESDDHIWQGTKQKRAPRVIEPDAGVSYHTCTSTDDTRVPYVILKKGRGQPKGVIVYIYGAYNVPSLIGTKRRWQPYLDAGWAIAVAMIRGGGDHTPTWSDAARTWRRERAVEDAEAVVAAARRELGLGAQQTCIYGRSAGGYIIGALVNRHPDADLFGAVYVEAAFLDVLRTMSQPHLPAVTAESNEFGDPLKRVADLETLVRLSPVDNVPPGGTPALFVVARTALGDIEVYAYESVKWMERLKTGGHLFIGNAGHFTESADVYTEYAEDFVLLEEWLGRQPAPAPPPGDNLSP
jgi:protease II